MISAVIIDDEPKAVKSLSTLLQWYCEDEVEVIGDANDIVAGQALIKEKQPQLVFLDVEIGKDNGFMLLEKIRKMEEEVFVIFTTGHSEYAINAIRKDAFDYLMKPVDPEDLQKAVQRLKKRLEQPSKPVKEEAPLNSETSLSLPMQDQVRVCKLSEILRCESERNYTRFYLVDGSALLVSRNLGSYEELLVRNNFFRPHKSHVINLAHLKSYIRQDGGYLLMNDGSQIPLARAQRAAMFELLGI